MAGLHVDRYEYTGTGSSAAPLLLIHGWGMHGGMWSGVAEQLAHNFSVMAVDLPGHGYSAGNARGKGQDTRSKEQDLSCALPLEPLPFTLDSVVDALSAQFDGPLTVCGWSLGGQVALRWAMRYPQQVERMVMVASTPSFVRREGWGHALNVEILEEFADNLRHHFALTLKRFLALQVRGSEQERNWLNILRERLFSRGEPDLAALQSGLEILRGCDLRDVLPQVTQATLVLAGERDTLIPLQAAQYLASRIPGGQLAAVKGAAHAPFLSHPEEFVLQLRRFMESNSN